MEKNRVNYEFWDIVEKNNLYEDVLVPVLADNSLVRHTVMTLPFLAERGDREDCEMELEKFLNESYGLPPVFSEAVFDLCAQNIKLNRGCERWVEPDGQA